ncbi:MAG: glycosyltransferase family 39 protein [Leptolyngbyaceae bacterium]|nr:glycosyltransferase family 39 protein [Leptolyngbyaceae bacterium]
MTWGSSRPLPIALLSIVIAIGIFFRVARLDYKVYWHDEVFTSIRAAGFVGEEVSEALYTAEIKRPDDLLRYQTLEPGRGWNETFYALSTHPEHPPLYYVLVRLWMNLFGTSIATIRSLSVVFSLLIFPVLYWLCLALFHSPAVGQMAIALYAVSPFHVLYAQEARQYILWTLTTILSSLLLLRALDKDRPQEWMAYAGAIAMGFYTSLFSVLVCLAHAGYTVMRTSGRLNATVLRFSLAIMAGVLLFIPWIGVVVKNWGAFQNKTAWVNFAYPIPLLAKLWGLHLSSTFVDMGLPLDHPYSLVTPIIVWVGVVIAFYRLIRIAPVRTWGFVVLLTVIPAIALILPDLLMGGRRSASTRYFVPVLIGVLLAVAFLLAEGLAHPTARYRWGIRGLTAVVLTASLLSCSISFQSNTWWSKVVSYGVPRTAALVNPKPNPLIVVGLREVSLGNAIALSHFLEDHVRLILTQDSTVPELPGDASDLFLYDPHDALIQAFENDPQFMLQPLPHDNIYVITDTESSNR